jgi:hypothetical protein
MEYYLSAKHLPFELKRLCKFDTHLQKMRLFSHSARRDEQVSGHTLDGERESIGHLAERLPGVNVHALQQFVGQSPWAWKPARRMSAHRLEDELLPTVAWIIDGLVR